MTEDGTPATIAFALGGAGTKGAFEMGVLRYAVDEAGLVPDVITGASAGAIIGTVLAQARGRDQLVEMLDVLQQDLLAMTDTSVVFAKQPWLAEFDGTPLGDAVDAFITVRTRPPVPADPDAPPTADAGAPPKPSRHRHHRFHDLVGLMAELTRALHSRKHLKDHAGSLLTLDPLEQALRGNGPETFASLDVARVRRPGVQLRLAITPLHAGVTHYVTADGTIVGPDAQTPLPGAAAGPIDLIEGVLASSSVPMIFAPRPLASDVYVDGGVLQNVPVEAAAALGARHIIGVLGVPLATPPDDRDLRAVSFVDIHLRAGNIGFSETQRRNVHPALPDGVELTVVAPTLDVVGPFEVAQGLMLLDMDYGWLRAGETLVDLDDDVRAAAMAASDALTAARERAWYLEEDLWATGEATPTQLEQLGRTKAEVRSGLEARAHLGLAAPAGSARWWSEYEHHATPPPSHLPDRPPTESTPG